MKKTLLYLVVSIVALGLIAPGASAKWWYPEKNVNVMTRNLYLGADIFKVVEAAQVDPDDPSYDPLAVPFAVADVFQTMLYTNFWARAEAIADEIARAKPDVIGLQEVSTYYIQTPGDYLDGNPVQADTVVIDFYKVLKAALKARGMRYRAFKIANADVELPMVDPNAGPPDYLSDVRLVDHDVVLVRKGIPAWKVLAKNYDWSLELDIGDDSVEFTRGFVIVDAIIKGKIFRFANTHLEVRSDSGSIFRLFQSWQMEELLETIGYLDGLPFLGNRPVIMVGDFNSSPEDETGYSLYLDKDGLPREFPYTPPYRQALDAGYLDAWLLQSSYGDGYTDAFDELVSDPTAVLTTRIDHIFLDEMDLAIDSVECEVVGDEVSDMVSYPDPDPDEPDILLWPSDHAGVVAKIKFSKPYRPWWLRFRWSPR